MDYRPLGRTDIRVSTICLGSMTWGEQNSEAEGFEQMDYALDQGVNFIDTAEMYPLATRAETYGRTEEIIGNWMAARGSRDKVVIATKIVGPNPERFAYIRGGETRFNKKHISAAGRTTSISTSCTGRTAPPTTSARWPTSTRTAPRRRRSRKPSRPWTRW